jgi:hypothetical protein
MTTRRFALSLMISLAALLLSTAAAQACDTWNGATATWGTNADWSEGVPTRGANVCIESGR